MTYREYLASDHWKELRARYYARYPRQCKACGATRDIQLHHRTYKRLGKEWLMDLVPLCAEHHKALHDAEPDMRGMWQKTRRFYRETAKSIQPADSISWSPKGYYQIQYDLGRNHKLHGRFKTPEAAARARDAFFAEVKRIKQSSASNLQKANAIQKLRKTIISAQSDATRRETKAKRYKLAPRKFKDDDEARSTDCASR